jgi:steroid delta-isomerase-like uncharacterized protein
MSIEDNKALVRRGIEEAWNQRNLAVLDELYAPDFVYHSDLTSLEAYKQAIELNLTAFPDLHFTIEDMVAEGDRVGARWTFRGTHQGLFQDIPPTGKQVTITGISIFRVANGKGVEVWTDADYLGMLQQLGVVPALGQAS